MGKNNIIFLLVTEVCYIYMNRYDATKKISILGIAANIFLLIIKLAAGFMSKSQAMIADGFNSAGDVFASSMTYAGNRIASKPTDKTHPYGHGKAEYIFSMIISFSLALVSFRIFASSLNSIINYSKLTFNWYLLATAITTIIMKTALFLFTKKQGKKYDSLLIIANSEDHRNDVFVTSSTLASILFSKFGVYWLDGAVGIGISLWIGYTSYKIYRSSYRVLMDTNIDELKYNKINNIISSIEGVDHIDDIKAKPIGNKYLVIVKVSVNGSIPVSKGHSIAAEIRHQCRKIDFVNDAVVHINPV